MDGFSILDYTSTFLSVLFFAALYVVTRFILSRKSVIKAENSLLRQSILVTILTIGFFSVILSLPIDPATKDRITTLLGYMISAIVALSSATFFGNILAGFLIRLISTFKPGDFVEVGDHFGCITVQGLFHIELQTNDRNLITLPNLYLAINPVKVIRRSGSYVSTAVSLGYDVSRLKIEKCLREAADRAGLDPSFVYITELGDYSVTYRVYGKQNDTKELPDMTSILNAMVLDTLHEARIEIVSPSFMNQRPIGEKLFIPEDLSRKIKDFQQDLNASLLVFDKGEQAATIKERQEKIEKFEAKINELKIHLKKADDEQKEELEAMIDRYADIKEKLKLRLDEQIEAFEGDN